MAPTGSMTDSCSRAKRKRTAGLRSDCHHDCHGRAEQNADAKETSASTNNGWSGSPARHSHLPDFRALCLVGPVDLVRIFCGELVLQRAWVMIVDDDEGFPGT